MFWIIHTLRYLTSYLYILIEIFARSLPRHPCLLLVKYIPYINQTYPIYRPLTIPYNLSPLPSLTLSKQKDSLLPRRIRLNRILESLTTTPIRRILVSLHI